MLNADLDIGTMFLVALALVCVIVFYRWRQQRGGVGLVTTYLILFSVAYLLPGFLYSLPDYVPLYDRATTALGFQQVLYATIAFAVGTILLAPKVVSSNRDRLVDKAPDAKANANLIKVYFVIGLVAYFVSNLLGANVASITAIVTGIAQLTLVGQALGCWQAIQEKKWRNLFGWLGLAALWPLVTIVSKGFLSFGTFMAVIVIMFAVYGVGFRKWYIPAGVLAIYIGLSVLVNYGLTRSQIRSVVWGGDTTIVDRLGATFDTVSNFGLFDPSNPRQLYFIDRRQIWDYLIGSAVNRLSTGQVEYANGQTLTDAVLALIPRAIWTDKPIGTGGSSRVTEFTGIVFYGGTSIGMGQVLEFYANFGTWGVIVGFVLLGIVLAVIDESAALHLRSGNWQKFALWYALGIGLMQPDNSLLALSLLSTAGFCAVILANRFLIPALTVERGVPSRELTPYTRSHDSKPATW